MTDLNKEVFNLSTSASIDFTYLMWYIYSKIPGNSNFNKFITRSVCALTQLTTTAPPAIMYSHFCFHFSKSEILVEAETVKLTSKGKKAKATKETKTEIKSVSSSKVAKPKVTKKEKVTPAVPEAVKSKRGRKKKS